MATWLENLVSPEILQVDFEVIWEAILFPNGAKCSGSVSLSRDWLGEEYFERDGRFVGAGLEWLKKQKGFRVEDPQPTDDGDEKYKVSWDVHINQKTEKGIYNCTTCGRYFQIK